MVTFLPHNIQVGVTYIIEGVRELNDNYDILPSDLIDEFEETQDHLLDMSENLESRAKGAFAWVTLAPEVFKFYKQAKMYKLNVVTASQKQKLKENKNKRTPPHFKFTSSEVEANFNVSGARGRPIRASVRVVPSNPSVTELQDNDHFHTSGGYFQHNFSSITLAKASDKLETAGRAVRSSGSYHADLEETIHSLEQARIKLAKYKVEIPPDYSAEFKSMFVKNVTTLHQLMKHFSGEYSIEADDYHDRL